MKDSIEEIVVKSGDKEIKINDVSALKIGSFTMTPEMIEELKIVSQYKYSCDINNMMDHLILNSFENDDDAKDTLNKIRAMFCIRDFFEVYRERKCRMTGTAIGSLTPGR